MINGKQKMTLLMCKGFRYMYINIHKNTGYATLYGNSLVATK